ncbi:hypothetical protein F5Y12DRAFT_19608 [Xylaria sp. FL1777]|nr:hypothetical protein F5Y12DRAFT_19608 [Xylaria sp. FL1777]
MVGRLKPQDSIIRYLLACYPQRISLPTCLTSSDLSFIELEFDSRRGFATSQPPRTNGLGVFLPCTVYRRHLRLVIVLHAVYYHGRWKLALRRLLYMHMHLHQTNSKILLLVRDLRTSVEDVPSSYQNIAGAVCARVAVETRDRRTISDIVLSSRCADIWLPATECCGR